MYDIQFTVFWIENKNWLYPYISETLKISDPFLCRYMIFMIEIKHFCETTCCTSYFKISYKHNRCCTKNWLDKIIQLHNKTILKMSSLRIFQNYVLIAFIHKNILSILNLNRTILAINYAGIPVFQKNKFGMDFY